MSSPAKTLQETQQMLRNARRGMSTDSMPALAGDLAKDVAKAKEAQEPHDSDAAAKAGIASEGARDGLWRFGLILVCLVVIAGGAAFLFLRHDDLPPPRQVREITVVKILPPPPPPPPPPPMPEQKMIEQPKMAEQEFKEDKPVERPKEKPMQDSKADEPPGPLSLDAKAVGPGDLFNLGGKPGGSPYGGGQSGGSRWGWYASIVQAQIESAFRANQKTRSASMRVEIRIWADSSGRVTRVQLSSSTGSPDLDATIRNDVLGHLTLREPPPKDMPMPMVTRVTERRPS
jgi:periplasmic protein TonB